ncbi:MAG: diaminopimelate decarboxylase [Bryobacterales bacterium]|nr:diaminopimelate decarboxylase [Bryobacterales bacterium]
MNSYHYSENTLYCEQVALADIARRAGTPCFVYSQAEILGRFNAYKAGFGDTPHEICYAVKANSNLSILRLLAGAGAGFDIVSGGELFRVLKAGGDPGKVVFSGVGKTAQEIDYAIASGIHSFNCESPDEMRLIDSIAARLGKKVRVAFRVNPDIDARTHPYISTGLKKNKFGIAIRQAPRLYGEALEHKNLLVEGVSCHIGSQILETDPLVEAADRVLELVEGLRAAGVPIQYLDLGGGLGVSYQAGEPAPDITDTVRRMVEHTAGRNLTLHIEPGRSIVGPAGVLVTRVLYRKHTEQKEFVVVDAAMTELIRPALYNAHHDIVPLRAAGNRGTFVADVVGPVCETGDFLAHDRKLPQVMPGDLLAVCTAGAYGFAQSSNYNSRPRPAEVLVDGAQWTTIRTRETYDDLVRGE